MQTYQTAISERVEFGHLSLVDTPLQDAYSTPGCLGHTAPGSGLEPANMQACTHTHTKLSLSCHKPLEMA